MHRQDIGNGQRRKKTNENESKALYLRAADDKETGRWGLPLQLRLSERALYFSVLGLLPLVFCLPSSGHSANPGTAGVLPQTANLWRWRVALEPL